jgi:hypothetical protein
MVQGGLNIGVGNTAAGSIVQLVAKGAMDKYLTDNASRTYWKGKYEKVTCFAMESVIQSFNSQVQFGATSQITLNRTGDLVYYMYVVVELPGIKPVRLDGQSSAMGMRAQFPSGNGQGIKKADAAVFADYCVESDISVSGGDEVNSAGVVSALKKGKARWLQEKYASVTSAQEDEDLPDGDWCCWTNAIGQLLIKCASIVIGGSTIDTLYSDFLFMWEELTGKSGKRLTEMIGKRDSVRDLCKDSGGSRLLYIPLPFWFTLSSSQSLSLSSLQFHQVQVHVEIERLEHCIIVSDDKKVGVVDVATNQPLNNNSIAAALDTTYVYLDTCERAKFATTHFEQLIVQLQTYTISSTNSNVRLSLNWNHPCLEMIFSVRRKIAELNNAWFNYAGLDGRDPVVSASLNLNNQPRVNNRPGNYLRLVQPYQFHTNIPESHIYVYSFALHPEQTTPSGSCNCSRIDHCDLILQLQEGLAKEPVTIIVYCRSFNVLRFREGLAGVAYAN